MTTYAKMRGFKSTPMPAMISMTPTASMNMWPFPPTMLLTTGARYLSQSVRMWKNLSAPAMTGARKKPMRRIQNACRAGVLTARVSERAIAAAWT